MSFQILVYIQVIFLNFSRKVTILCTDDGKKIQKPYAKYILNIYFLFTSYLMENLSVIMNVNSSRI